MKRKWICSTLPTALALFLSGNVFGARYYVKPGGGTTGGTSWSTAFGNPEYALEAVNQSGGDEIWIAAGSYLPLHAENGSDARSKTFRLRFDTPIYGGFAGTETSLNQRDPLHRLTILNGDDTSNFGNRSDNAYHVILSKPFPDPNPNCDQDCHVIDIDDSTIVDGFVIRGGAATGSGGDTLPEGSSDSLGGGTLIITSKPVFQNCLFTDNLATAGGGGHTSGRGSQVIIGGPIAADPKFISCSFVANHASGAAGGLCNSQDTTTFLNTTFSHNTADNAGGALHNPNIGGQGAPKTINVINCSLSLNDCSTGSAINNGGTATVKNSIIWGNTPSNQAQINNTGTLNITYSDYQNGGLSSPNIDADPLFISAAGDNLRIDKTSPCRNTALNSNVPQDAYDVDNDGVTTGGGGEPTPDRDRLDRVRNTTVDMGAYESHASATCCADITGDGQVDVNDLLAVITSWGGVGIADVAPVCGGNGVVDVSDLLLIISNWNNPECGAESYDAGSLQSVEDCMNMATEVYTEFSPEWYELVNKCIAGLCEAHIIDCD